MFETYWVDIKTCKGKIGNLYLLLHWGQQVPGIDTGNLQSATGHDSVWQSTVPFCEVQQNTVLSRTLGSSYFGIYVFQRTKICSNQWEKVMKQNNPNVFLLNIKENHYLKISWNFLDILKSEGTSPSCFHNTTHLMSFTTFTREVLKEATFAKVYFEYI